MNGTAPRGKPQETGELAPIGTDLARTGRPDRSGRAAGARPAHALALGNLLPGLVLAGGAHHLAEPADQHFGVGLLLRLAGKRVVGAGDAPLGQRARAG